MTSQLGGNVLVTGTNRGIGLELVRQLAEKTGKDSHIFATCRDPDGDSAKTLRDVAAQYPGKITILKLEISDEASIRAAFEAVSEKICAAGLNLLVNNAAINKPPLPGSLAATGKQDMMDVFETNVVGPFLLGKIFLPLLQRAAAAEEELLDANKDGEMSCRRSAIINISTLLSSIELCSENFHQAQLFPYRTSKAALNMLTRCQAEEFKKDNILVVAIHPGWVRTDMGGEMAPLTTQDSVHGMLAVMSSLGRQDTGMLCDWVGERMPW